MDRAMPPDDPLSRELTLYEERKNDWLSAHLNQFVVIAGTRVEGFYPDYATAFKAGIRAFGIKQHFLIKEVCATEPVYVIY